MRSLPCEVGRAATRVVSGPASGKQQAAASSKRQKEMSSGQQIKGTRASPLCKLWRLEHSLKPRRSSPSFCLSSRSQQPSAGEVSPRGESNKQNTAAARNSLRLVTSRERGNAPRSDAEAHLRHADWQPCPCARKEETVRRRRTDEGSGHARGLNWSMRSVISVMCHAEVERMRQHRCSSAQEQASMLLWHG